MASDNRPNTGSTAGGTASSEAAFKREVESLAAEVSQQVRQHERQEVGSVKPGAVADLPQSTMTLEQALKSDSPEARNFVADHFMKLNQTPGPQRAKKFYKVDNEDPVEAYDELDAIAVTNDRKHSLKGPHGRKVVEFQRELATAG